MQVDAAVDRLQVLQDRLRANASKKTNLLATVNDMIADGKPSENPAEDERILKEACDEPTVRQRAQFWARLAALAKAQSSMERAVQYLQQVTRLSSLCMCFTNSIYRVYPVKLSRSVSSMSRSVCFTWNAAAQYRT